jgi:hypothetical protein
MRILMERNVSARSIAPPSAPVIVSIACWIDLLGYGALLNAASFDPSCAAAKRAIARLRRFQEVVAEHSRATYPTLVINDGAVAYRDVGLQRRDRVWPFIERSWALFDAATKADRALRGDGLRAVVAAGLRAKGSNRGLLDQQQALTQIVENLAANRISKEAALQGVRAYRRLHDVVPQLQANFAFARAYTAEQGGRAEGLGGAYFYLDTRLFSDGVPYWVSAGPQIDWRPTQDRIATLATSFVAVDAFNAPSTLEAQAATRNGRELHALLRHRERPD